jgi:abhydrolase domain-containing protein 12
MFSSGAPDKIFVLTFDYRGFGLSSGAPSEQGCINDAVAVIDWALNVANIPPNRIVIVGHSLGTAIATAAIHHYLHLPEPVEFNGMILCAGFSNAKNAFISYAIGGVVPLLVPLKYFEPLEFWFGRRINDTWKTDERLAEIVDKSSHLQLAFFHANNDLTMPWQQTELLFKGALSAALGKIMGEEELKKHTTEIDLGEGGVEETYSSSNKIMSKLIMRHGGKLALIFPTFHAAHSQRTLTRA